MSDPTSVSFTDLALPVALAGIYILTLMAALFGMPGFIYRALRSRPVADNATKRSNVIVILCFASLALSTIAFFSELQQEKFSFYYFFFTPLLALIAPVLDWCDSPRTERTHFLSALFCSSNLDLLRTNGGPHRILRGKGESQVALLAVVRSRGFCDTFRVFQHHYRHLREIAKSCGCNWFGYICRCLHLPSPDYFYAFQALSGGGLHRNCLDPAD
ncbi:MAG: hypothetical protein M3Y21_03240 [Candidatus Eremiobacteraeota bacterium]|nr:hypothetical protein [Candidatus Eremiobacteraeota bacterium]